MRNPFYIGAALHNLAAINYFEIQDHNEALRDKSRKSPKELKSASGGQERMLKARREYQRKISKLGTQMKLHNRSFKSVRAAKRFKAVLRKKYSFENVLKEDNSTPKQNLIGHIVDSLEDSTLPKDARVHPLRDFPSSPPMNANSIKSFIEKLQKQEEQQGVVPLLFASLWLQEHGYKNVLANSNIRVKPIEDIRIIEDMYTADSKQLYLGAPYSLRTCLFLAELYLTHSREVETANYWATYGEKLATRYNSPEDYCKAKALIAAHCIETGDIGNAVLMLSKLEDEEYSERDLGILAMAKALLGIALKERDPNKSVLKIEEARRIKESLPPFDEKRALMILPTWSLQTHS